MATLKTIRKRIVSVKNTQKITKAMKMVAAAKLRRAQQAVITIRPYADRLQTTLDQVVAKSDQLANSFFIPRSEVKKRFFLVFTSNRGLCGGFNSNLLRRVETFLKQHTSATQILDVDVIGKKGRDFFRARKRPVRNFYQEYADSLPFEEAVKLAEGMLQSYVQGEYDEYYIAFNRFKSALSQDVQITKLVPFESKSEEKKESVRQLVDFIYEPTKKEFLDKVIPLHLAAEIYRAHRESVASELGARMSAMENATSNAKEMIRLLTLQYNRIRQAVITKELMDIVNGAESIK